MAKNLFISYQIKSPDQVYFSLVDEIKKLGSWTRIHQSYWYVKSSLTAEQAAQRVWSKMGKNDLLIVVDASNNTQYSYNLNPDVEKHIKHQWGQL